MFRLLFSNRLIGLHLLALVATGAAGWLGLWQYDAWQTGRTLAASDLANAAPKMLENVMAADDPFPGNAVGQPVEIAGRWVDDASFLVSGRELQGRSGFWAVTPVAVCADRCMRSPAMLVVRGWTERRDALSDPPSGPVELTGWLQPPEGSGRPDPDPRDDVLPEMRIADAIQRVDQDLFGAYVIAEDMSSSPGAATDATTGLEPVTPASLPRPEAFASVRNLLYALEWWVFGAFALFVWWRWCRDAIEDDACEVTVEPGADSADRTSTASLR